MVRARNKRKHPLRHSSERSYGWDHTYLSAASRALRRFLTGNLSISFKLHIKHQKDRYILQRIELYPQINVLNYVSKIHESSRMSLDKERISHPLYTGEFSSPSSFKASPISRLPTSMTLNRWALAVGVHSQ